jgi:hypothetical protein
VRVKVNLRYKSKEGSKSVSGRATTTTTTSRISNAESFSFLRGTERNTLEVQVLYKCNTHTYRYRRRYFHNEPYYHHHRPFHSTFFFTYSFLLHLDLKRKLTPLNLLLLKSRLVQLLEKVVT